MKRAVLGFIAAILLAACAAHEKAGDRAAALGDWKSAYTAYRAALAEEPDNPEVKAKFAEARVQALAETQKRAQTCAQVGDWGCALAESDFALGIDGTNAEIAAFRARAATEVALGQLQTANEQAMNGQITEALSLMERANQLSAAPEVKARATEVRRTIVTQGKARADAFRKERNLIAAQELAQVVVGLDVSHAKWAQGIAAEYEQFVTAEYERLAGEGDAARARREWPLAQERYQQALSMRNGGRAGPLADYSRQMADAEQRLANRDWNGAADAYAGAVRTGQDDGYASQQLERVRPRPYRVALRAVMVDPFRPDGQTWVGVANPIFNRLARRLVQMADRKGMSDLVLDLAMSLPRDNQPVLRVEALLPEGIHLTTPQRQGIYTDFDAEFVTVANAFDDRQVTFNVLMDSPRGTELMGTVVVPLRDLAEHRELSLEGRSVLSLRLATTHGDGRQPGSFAGMAVVQPPPPPGPPSGHAATPVP
jgi:hypothetical protein